MIEKSFFRDMQGGFYDGYRRYKDDEKTMLTRVIKYNPGAVIFDIDITQRFDAYYKALTELGYKDVAEDGFKFSGLEFSYIVTITGECVAITIRTSRDNFIRIRNARYLMDTNSGSQFLQLYRTLKQEKLKDCYTMTNATSGSFRRHLGAEYSALFPDCSKTATGTTGTAYDFFYDGYRGGWCYLPEERDTGAGYVYDINSLYPYIFSRMPMPVGMCAYEHGKPKGHIMEKARAGNVFILMRVEAEFELKIGFLPFITPHKNEAPQSSGTAVLYLTLPELNLLKEHYETKIKFLDYIYMQSIRGIDRGYVDGIYKEKSVATGIQRQIAKNKLNFLIGSFSRKRDRTNLVKSGGRWKLVKRQLSTPSQMYIGSAVTSYARCKIVQCAQKNYKNFVYSDTDSLHLTAPAEGIKIGDGLGEFKLEAEYREGAYRKRKFYGYTTEQGHKLVLAGVPKDISEAVGKKFLDHPISDIVDHIGDYAGML